VYYKKDDVIVQQNQVGDAFYILEEGLLTVTRRLHFDQPLRTDCLSHQPTGSIDSSEVREVKKLSANAHFGDLCLLTVSPHVASVTVESATAKCLTMTKPVFEQLMAASQMIQSQTRRKIGVSVLSSIPLFAALTASQRMLLLDSMTPLNYLDANCICRQGAAANSFFLIIKGILLLPIIYSQITAV
jgi:CRP-like cAMP-binding protein